MTPTTGRPGHDILLSAPTAITDVGTQDKRLFPLDRWQTALPALSRQFSQQAPFPHVHLTDFFDADTITTLVDAWPRAVSGEWVHWKHYNENKLGLNKRSLLPRFIGCVIDELNGPPFVSWLSELTGIPDLIADPDLEGGGLHQAGPGGFLNVHADFAMHHHRKNWRRRVNVIVYLNRMWDIAWGGAIELWDTRMRGCVVRIPPLCNHAVIFKTDDDSYHGFPDPISCPPGVSRRSLALYYYTLETDMRFVPRSTNYQPRPGDGLWKKVLIWADKQAVGLYSRAKARFGLSDDLASNTLRLLHGGTSEPKNRVESEADR